ncbi:MAG: O-antigen ligase family protein [Candidatus Sulfotelmatobacter sp.]
MKAGVRYVLIALGVIVGVVLFRGLQWRPGYFANATLLGAVLALEIVIACLWRFEKIFLPATLGCFLLATTGLPFSGESLTLRWLFLGVGSLAGMVIWMRSTRARHFGLFHLVALFCVLSALASASASDAPKTALLKVASLFLLFLYAATGGRVALAGRERSLIRGLVPACEIAVFVVSAVYFGGYNIFENPNNLGAFIGVIAMPVLAWAALVAEDRGERQRRYTALGLCGVLLYATVCRAAIAADTAVLILLAIAMRRPGLLVKAAFAGALFLEIMAVANPSHMGELMDSLEGRFVFKIDEHRSKSGVFGSREGPWDDTIAAVRQHPYFGTGFGTSDVGSVDIQESSIYTVEGTNREHGSSYLAMAEYMGLLGIVPFLFLLVLLIRATGRAYGWARRTGSPAHYAVPFAMIVFAGLIHAGFEDWLFAAGSYLCVFFWVSGFLLIDLVSGIGQDTRVSVSRAYSVSVGQELRQPTM